MKKIIAILVLISIFSFSCAAQEKSPYTNSKSAIKSFNKAVKYMENGQNKLAISEINIAIEKDPGFLEAWLLKAEINDFLGNFSEAYLSYSKVFEIDPDYDPALTFKLAANSYHSGEYADAKYYIDYFCTHVDTVKYGKYDFTRLKEFIYFADHAFNNPVAFNPVNVGPGVNTNYDEYWPSLSVDEEVLVFTRQIPINPNNPSRSPESMQEDLFVSQYNTLAGTYQTAIPLPGGVNSGLNEGAQCISADGKTCVITACNRSDGLGSCDLYIMFLQNNAWTAPQNLKSVNSTSWDSNPSLSADGKYLFFSSGRAGGRGKTDIWVAEIDSRGVSNSAPNNLGSSINTEYEELSPFIHPDGKTLYFASKGHPGMGDFDLFFSRLDANNQWQKPVNVGYPINTNGEERSLIVNAKGEIAMFASTAGKRDLDIFYFEIPEEIKPVTVTYVKGYIYDSITKQRLMAQCEMIDLETEQKVVEMTSDPLTGEYILCLVILS